MAMHLDMLHVNGGGKGGKGIVPERVNGGDQLQVVGGALFQ
jgi:hypothetical protein